MFKEGLRWRVRDGWNIRVPYYPWLPESVSFKPAHNMFLGHSLKVRDLIDYEVETWKEDVSLSLFYSRDVELIEKIPLNRKGRRDVLIWNYVKKGHY